MADNLSLPQVASTQNQKEVTINAATLQLSGALADYTSYDLVALAANQTIALATFQAYMGYLVSTSSATYNTLTFPAQKRAIFWVQNSGTYAVTVKVGTTTKTVGVGNLAFFSADGTANGLTLLPLTAAGTAFTNLTDVPSSYTGKGRQLVRVNSGETALEFVNAGYTPAFYVPAKPTNSQLVYKLKAVVPFTLPISLTGSQTDAGTAATGSCSFSITKNGTSIGSINFAASGTVATFTFTAAVAFAAGDILEVTAPATADATLADIAISLFGYLT